MTSGPMQKGDPHLHENAKRWLHAAMGLARPIREGEPLCAEPDRAEEFVRFYFEHPEIDGLHRALCAEVVSESVKQFIEGIPGERHAAPAEAAESLVRRLLRDPYTDYELFGCKGGDHAPQNSRVWAIWERLFYGDTHHEDHDEAKRWVHAAMKLPGDPDESIHLRSDPQRAEELVRFYFSHPELRGLRRHFCAEVVVNSVMEFIDPEPVDELQPAPDDVAELLVRQLLTDLFATHYLLVGTWPPCRDMGAPTRLTTLVDRLTRVPGGSD